jgi:hypothetical protein
MQFTLQSLMLSFVVVAAAMGVCGPWGIGLGPYCLLLAACVRRARTSSKAAVIGLSVLLVMGAVFSLGVVAYFRYASEMERREKCVRNLRAITLASLTRENEGRRVLVIDRGATSAGCQVTVLNDVSAETRENSVIIFLPSQSQETELEPIPLKRVLDELELGERSKLIAAEAVHGGPWYRPESKIDVSLPNGDVRWLYGSYVRGHLDALLASVSRPINFDEADAFPARINWPWVVSLAILIASVAVLILRRIPSPEPARNPAL